MLTDSLPQNTWTAQNKINKMQHLTLRLTLEEINKILESLGNQPYVQVHELIRNIQEQATVQLSQGPESKN